MLKDKQQWCVVCGEKVGYCDHNGGTTDNIILAEHIWDIYNTKMLKKASKELQRRRMDVRISKTI